MKMMKLMRILESLVKENSVMCTNCGSSNIGSPTQKWETLYTVPNRKNW